MLYGVSLLTPQKRLNLLVTKLILFDDVTPDLMMSHPVLACCHHIAWNIISTTSINHDSLISLIADVTH